jgi:hypothetical protein
MMLALKNMHEGSAPNTVLYGVEFFWQPANITAFQSKCNFPIRKIISSGSVLLTIWFNTIISQSACMYATYIHALYAAVGEPGMS